MHDDEPQTGKTFRVAGLTVWSLGHTDAFNGQLPRFSELLDMNGKVRPTTAEYLRGYKTGLKESPDDLNNDWLC